MSDGKPAQRDAAEVDHQILTLEVYAYELDIVAAILDFYGCGGVIAAFGIYVEVDFHSHVEPGEIEHDLAEVDVDARLVEDVAEHACKADIGIGAFFQADVKRCAEVEDLVDDALYEHAARILCALLDFVRVVADFIRPCGSAAQLHIGDAYGAFGCGAVVIHVAVELTHEVQLHPRFIFGIAADGEVDIRVVVAKVGIQTEQFEEGFHRGEGYHSPDVVFRNADEHRFVCGKTRPIALIILFRQVDGGHIAFALLAAFTAGLRLAVVAVDHGFRVVERLAEHIVHKCGYIEVRSVILGHRDAEQGYIGKVNIQVGAVDYHGEEVGARFEEHFILTVFTYAHNHIIVEGELELAERVFGFFRIQGKAEGEGQTQLHATCVCFVLIERLEDEIESVCIGKSAVYKTEAVEQVAYAEHAARQRDVHIQIEREVAQQTHKAIRKGCAVGKVEYGGALF